MLVLPYQSEPGLVSFMVIAIIIAQFSLRAMGRGENHPLYPHVHWHFPISLHNAGHIQVICFQHPNFFLSDLKLTLLPLFVVLVSQSSEMRYFCDPYRKIARRRPLGWCIILLYYKKQPASKAPTNPGCEGKYFNCRMDWNDILYRHSWS